METILLPILLFVGAVHVALAVGMLVRRVAARARSGRGPSSKCRTRAAWTRSTTPIAGSTCAFTWWRSRSWCSTSSCCSSIPGRSPAATPAGHRRGGADAAAPAIGLIARAGLWRGDGLHRPAGAGSRLCLAEGGVPMAVATPARKRGRHQARRAGQLVPQEQPLADAVRHRLLRHRADGDRRQQARPGPLRGRGVSLQPAAVRPDDRRRPRGDEDAARAAAHLAADARAEVVHLDGGLRLDRRRVRHLLPSCRGSIASSPSTCTSPAARRGPSS